MPTQAEIYGYGFLANVICCLCSLGGAVVIPCARRFSKLYHVVISVFMGLAVGTLCSDALIHLIPEALGIHHHEDEEHHEENGTESETETHEGEEIQVEPYMWYMMVIMAGVYGFYLLEMVMTFIQNKSKRFKEENTAVVSVSAYTVTAPNSQHIGGKVEDSAVSNGNLESKIDDNEEDHKGLSPLVVMVIVGDAIHNFADGLAVAASFSVGNLEGLATTIAIFCHELPHELGDFAILLTSGMGFCKALIANLLSSLLALAGFFVGVPISTDETSRQWIFAITAGMFLYISLVDMLPQLTKHGSRDLKTCIYHNIGMWIGALIIVLLGVFEEHIEI